MQARQQRDYERQTLVRRIMKEAYHLGDEKMLDIADDLLRYIRLSVMRKFESPLSFEESKDYFSRIDEFARTEEEKNIMILLIIEKLFQSGTNFLHGALLKQQGLEPEKVYDADLLAQDD
jgi:hypothetical protein